MKKNITIFTVLLGILGLGVANASVTANDSVRNSVRSSGKTTQTATARGTATSNRGNDSSQSVVSRTATNTAEQKNIIIRNNSNSVQSRTATTPQTSAKNLTSRSTITTNPARSAVSRANTTQSKTSIGRTATQTPTIISRNATQSMQDIINNESKYSDCREIFYECMDEFCANKDADLKRCACSDRISEFSDMQNQIDSFEKELNKFNERLLTVSMDAEDALAISQATEGEIAFNYNDNSESKDILDEISDRLKSQTSQNNYERNMNAISLSLDIDSAFDNVNFMQGADTVLKEGTDLYNAILPTCREIVAEVCDAQALILAESGYKMKIEQDCNTVKKAYDSLEIQAANKVREGSALLDMSRLDTHQQRNSDDILTCKTKMLESMQSSSVCGENLSKCLDTTGQYINPTTGDAFLTVNLHKLSDLITRPTGNKTWAETLNNQPFVTYLESKKKYLEPAMENCQDVSDLVWEDFIEDALGKIKLAQGEKIEEIRQSCTTLTAECLSNNYDSITEFDSRALSIFGVLADKTVNEMCSDVRTSCSVLMENTGGGQNDWSTGIDGISMENTYATILKTCMQVGKSCMTESCTSISGNFALCEDVDGSPKRHSILLGQLCWDEVQACVESSGMEKINGIFDQFAKNDNFYDDLYKNYQTDSDCTSSNTDGICVYNQCRNKTGDDLKLCRLTEQIWGNCEYNPLDLDREENKILMPDTYFETLLSWFATNTNTEDIDYNCRVRACPDGFIPVNGTCIANDNIDSDGDLCATLIEPYEGRTNCCETNKTDSFGNCCMNTFVVYSDEEADINITICAPTPENEDTPMDGILLYTEEEFGSLYCIGQIGDTDDSNTNITENFPSGDTYFCDGKIIWITNDSHYLNPGDTSVNDLKVIMNFTEEDDVECDYRLYEGDVYETPNGCPPIGTINETNIKYM